VLVGMSKEDGSSQDGRRGSTLLPADGLLRPGRLPPVREGLVGAAGFCEVQREYIRHVVPSEIVTAKKPGA
jgi:hypothetical protein